MNTIVKGLSPRRLFTLVALVFTIFCFGRESRAQTQIIPQNQLSITGVDSEQSSDYRAANSIDGKANTMWHTTWKPIVAPLPHQITLQLSTSYIVTGLRYLPRQDGNKNGIITSYAVYVSPDGIMWDPPVAQGTWSGDSALKEVRFVGKQGRYVRLVAKAAANQFPYTSAAEINLLGILPPTEAPKTPATVKNLTWVDSSTNEDGFKIERRINTTGTFVRLAVVGANTTTYSDKDTLAGTTYCYRVQAFNAAGSSAFSNEACTGSQSIGALASLASTSILSNNQSSGALQSVTSSLSLPAKQGSSLYDQSAVNQQRLFVQIGVFRPSTGTWHLDRNANGKFDDCNIDSCVNTFGVAGDLPVVGDWLGSGASQLGLFNPATQMWDLDKNGNTIWQACDTDLCYGPFGKTEDLPISGFWQAGSKVATIGVYRPRTGQWFLDLNGNGRLDLASSDDAVLGPFGMPTDLPAVGDWTGTGKTRIGTFSPQTGQWRLDLNGNGIFDGCTIDRCVASFGRGKTYPVVADWIGSGISQIGIFDSASSMWLLDTNGNGVFDGCAIDHCVGPFGQAGDIPLVGQW